MTTPFSAVLHWQRTRPHAIAAVDAVPPGRM